jgi:hypothetical protein
VWLFLVVSQFAGTSTRRPMLPARTPAPTRTPEPN